MATNTRRSSRTRRATQAAMSFVVVNLTDSLIGAGVKEGFLLAGAGLGCGPVHLNRLV